MNYAEICIIKRDGKREDFSISKIKNAVSKAFSATGINDEQQLIADMPMHVWRCTVTKQEEAAYTRQYKIANMKLTVGGTELRILSEQQPCARAVQEDATLEDVFLYHFGETGGENNAVL